MFLKLFIAGYVIVVAVVIFILYSAGLDTAITVIDWMLMTMLYLYTWGYITK